MAGATRHDLAAKIFEKIEAFYNPDRRFSAMVEYEEPQTGDYRILAHS